MNTKCWTSRQTMVCSGLVFIYKKLPTFSLNRGTLLVLLQCSLPSYPLLKTLKSFFLCNHTFTALLFLSITLLPHSFFFYNHIFTAQLFFFFAINNFTALLFLSITLLPHSFFFFLQSYFYRTAFFFFFCNQQFYRTAFLFNHSFTAQLFFYNHIFKALLFFFFYNQHFYRTADHTATLVKPWHFPTLYFQNINFETSNNYIPEPPSGLNFSAYAWKCNPSALILCQYSFNSFSNTLLSDFFFSSQFCLIGACLNYLRSMVAMYSGQSVSTIKQARKKPAPEEKQKSVKGYMSQYLLLIYNQKSQSWCGWTFPEKRWGTKLTQH